RCLGGFLDSAEDEHDRPGLMVLRYPVRFVVAGCRTGSVLAAEPVQGAGLAYRIVVCDALPAFRVDVVVLPRSEYGLFTAGAAVCATHRVAAVMQHPFVGVPRTPRFRVVVDRGSPGAWGHSVREGHESSGFRLRWVRGRPVVRRSPACRVGRR